MRQPLYGQCWPSTAGEHLLHIGTGEHTFGDGLPFVHTATRSGTSLSHVSKYYASWVKTRATHQKKSR